MKELTGFPSGTADLSDGFEGVTIQDRDVVVRAIRDVEVPLLRVVGERHTVCRARASRVPAPHIVFP